MIVTPYSEMSKVFRWILRINQSELARIVGVSLSTVKSWESGRRPMSVQAVKFMESYVLRFQSNLPNGDFIDRFDFFGKVESCYNDIYNRSLKGSLHT